MEAIIGIILGLMAGALFAHGGDLLIAIGNTQFYKDLIKELDEWADETQKDQDGEC